MAAGGQSGIAFEQGHLDTQRAERHDRGTRLGGEAHASERVDQVHVSCESRCQTGRGLCARHRRERSSDA
eukprot:5557459-Prymnesium_polylepis.1